MSLRIQEKKLKCEGRPALFKLYSWSEDYKVPKQIPENTVQLYEVLFEDEEGGQAIQYCLPVPEGGSMEDDLRRLSLMAKIDTDEEMEFDFYEQNAVVERYEKGKEKDISGLLK